MNLNLISKEIRDILDIRRNKLQLTFEEDTHLYTMLDLNNKLRIDFPSVSKVYKKFYEEFDSKKKAFEMANGDEVKMFELLESWKKSGDLSKNQGSRVHFYLEDYLIKHSGDYKSVRQPIFNVNEEQIITSDNMIYAGKEFIQMMFNRGAVLLDTEIVLGCPTLGYVGQPDTAWLMLNNNNELGIVITDYKTNQPKNFEIAPYTKNMLKPFENYPNIALTHYYIQIPLYARLLLSMLKNTKYDNIKFFGGVVVLLKKDGNFVEYRIPKDIIEKVFNLNFKEIL